jgi:hypothetical chaperone protein
MRLGIDFGTTNSAAALYDGGKLLPVEIDSTGDPTDILPSLLYIDRRHRHYTGLQAMREYALRETGRPVFWKRKLIGEFEVMVAGPGSGPITFMQEAYAFYDEAALGRLLQSVKTALRDGTYQGTLIFERFYTLDQLITILLRTLKERAEHQFKKPCTEIILGRPVRFSHHDGVDRRAEEILYKAARWAGFTDIRFQAEPVGAMYLYHSNSPQRKRVLVFDFGGGTLDFTVADIGAGFAPHILATHGVLVGGDDLDRELMRHLLKYFGTGAKLGNAPFPYEILDLLLNWQTMPEVSRPEYHEVLHDFRTQGTNPKAILALNKLVNHKLGFALFKEIERVKKELSTAPTATLVFREDPIHIHEIITRPQFEKMIATQVAEVEAGLECVLEKAAVTAADIDVVLRTGGSSLIPVFINMLTRKFGANRLEEMHPLTSIVGGLGIAAYEQIGKNPVYARRYPDLTDAQSVITNIRTASGNPIEPYLIQVGEHCYTDHDTVLTKIPVELSHLPALRLTQADYQSEAEIHIEFHLPVPATIYVAFSATASELPLWLRTFEPTDYEIVTWDDWYRDKRYHVYKRDFPAGKVTLGGTQAEGYAGKVNLHYLVILQAHDG